MVGVNFKSLEGKAAIVEAEAVDTVYLAEAVDTVYLADRLHM